MSIATTRHTVDEYFETEIASQFRHEYIDGEIIEMTGGSVAHNLLYFNLTCQLVYQFNNPHFWVCLGNTRIKIEAENAYCYPDAAVVICPVERELDRWDTVLNPSVVFEILSPSTEHIDRGRKLKLYKQILSLTHYVLISQDEIAVECFSRVGDGEWFQECFTKVTDTLRFPLLDWNLQLSDLYKNFKSSE